MKQECSIHMVKTAGCSGCYPPKPYALYIKLISLIVIVISQIFYIKYMHETDQIIKRNQEALEKNKSLITTNDTPVSQPQDDVDRELRTNREAAQALMKKWEKYIKDNP